MKQLIGVLSYLSLGIFIKGNDINLSPNDTINNLQQELINCISQTNPEVMESTIFKVIQLQYYSPEKSFKHLVRSFNLLSKYGKTPRIRCKAYIASKLLDNPDIINYISQKTFRNERDFWETLINHISSLEDIDDKLIRPFTIGS